MSDKVKVEVVRASKSERIIDFKIVGMKSNKKSKKTIVLNRKPERKKQNKKRKRRFK